MRAGPWGQSALNDLATIDLPIGGRLGRMLTQRPRVSIIALFSAALALLIAITAWLSWRSYRDAREAAEQQLTTIAQTLEQHAGRSFAEVLRIVWSANEFVGVRQHGAEWDESLVHYRLRQLSSDSPQIRSLLIADRDGRVVVDSRSFPTRDFDVSKRDYFLAHKQNPTLGTFLGTPVLGQLDRIWLVGMSQRLQAPDGSFAGTVSASIDLRYFETFYGSLALGPSRAIVLLHGDGRLLLADPPIKTDDHQLDELSQAVAGNWQEPQRILTRDPRGSGEEGIYVLRHIPQFNLVLMVGRSDRDLLANWAQETERVGLIVMIAAVLLSAGLYLVLRYLEGLYRAQDLGRRLVAAIEESRDQLAIYDADDRLWFGNKQFWEMNRGNARIGARFDEMLTEGLALGHFPAAFGREAEWVSERMEQRRSSGKPIEIQRQNGRWLMLRDERLPDGGIITVATDVTDRKAAEQALREQAERHRRVIDTVPHGICATDTQSNILYANMAMHRMFGLSNGELVGRNLFEFEATPEAAKDRRKLFDRWVGMGKEPERYLHQFRASDGRLFDVEVDWDYTRGSRGEIEGFAGVFTDVTELRRAKDRLQDAVESIESGFSLFDAEDRLVLCNAAFVEAYLRLPDGVSPIGMTFEQLTRAGVEANLFDGSFGKNQEEWLRQRIELHRNPPQHPIEQRLSDGRWFLVHERRTREGGVVGIRTDITLRKAQERALIEAKTQAELASRAKSDFLANMSHELRTPLNAIIGFAELLAGQYFGELNQKQKEYAEHIHASGEHLLNIINDILDMSKIEAGRFELSEEEIDLADAVAACLKIVSGRAADAGVQLQNLVAPGVAFARVDLRALKQVILNLLSNAIKFTEPGGRISIDLVLLQHGEAAVRVADTGVGIPAAHLHKIFEPFLQADGSVSRRFGGTGLGLSISRKLMEVHGGRLEIESEEGAGTRVMAILPASRTNIASPQRFISA